MKFNVSPAETLLINLQSDSLAVTTKSPPRVFLVNIVKESSAASILLFKLTSSW